MMEKNTLFTILREQNYWFREPGAIRHIPRPQYLEGLESFMDSKAILIIKGPRRAGKTVLMDLIIRNMIAEGKCGRERILYVNIEDYRFYDHYSLELLEKILQCFLENIFPLSDEGSSTTSPAAPGIEEDPSVEENAGVEENSDIEENPGIEEDSGIEKNPGIEENSGIEETASIPDKPDTVYFFIDEIQHIPGFEHYLRTKYDQADREYRIKFIITGSNARLLSKELGTLLTGRIVSMEVFPFSFEEFLSYHHVEFDDHSFFMMEQQRMKVYQKFNSYIKNGGIPEFLDEADPSRRLQEYFDNVLFRDIVERHNIRNVRQLKELALYLITNAASQFSVNKISRMLGASVNTITAYLSDLECSYLILYLKQYSPSFRKQITTRSKVYCVDTGLMNAVGFRFSEGRGHLLENAVYVHLKRLGKEVYFYRNSTNQRECDFLLKDGLNVVQAIQVAQDLGSASVRKREIDGLMDAVKEFDLHEGLILTDDEFDTFEHDAITIKVRPIWFWLLNNEE